MVDDLSRAGSWSEWWFLVPDRQKALLLVLPALVVGLVVGAVGMWMVRR